MGVGTFALAMLPFVLARQSKMLVTEPWWVLIGATALGSALLVGRRRCPWRVWVASTAVGLVAVTVGGGPTSAYVPAVVALFTVSSRVVTVRAVLAALASVILPVALILGVGRDGALDVVAFGMTAWSGFALMAGIAIRSQKAVVASAHERARLAEATREEEAQRRVTEERFRIARELHDVIAHHVSVINVQAGVASHLVRGDPDGAAVAMGHVREASQTVLREVSDMLGLLRTEGQQLETAPVPQLADVGALVERARRSGIRVTWQTTGQSHELAPSVDLTAYRVVQEALTNASRHGTGSVEVQLDFAGGGLTLEITNPCIPTVAADRATDSATDRVTGHGLAGMGERIAAVGGSLEAGPRGRGEWVVRVRLPDGIRPAHLAWSP